jgi:8-oxo-dGTP diphosphatase
MAARAPVVGGELIEVAAGVLVVDGRALACQRLPTGRHPLKWEFPGGKVEPGEHPRTALVRELHEELALEAAVGEALWETTHRYPGGGPPIRITFFQVTAIAGEPTNRAFAALRWVAPAALHTLDFLDGDREFVDALGAGAVRLAPTERRASDRLT